MQSNLYATPIAAVADPVSRDRDGWLPASRGARFLAALLDNICYSAGIILVVVKAGIQRGWGEPTNLDWAIMAALFLVVITVDLVLMYRSGQTIGKRLVGIKMVRLNGEQAGLGRLFGLRFLLPNVLFSLPLLGPILALVDIAYIFREDRRCMHDWMADTKVVEV